MRWNRERLDILDQRRLSDEIVYFGCEDAPGVARAIRAMAVRGAPAIAIAAGYGIALAARERAGLPADARKNALVAARDELLAARPTAVHLAHALARFEPLIQCAADAGEFAALAEVIHAENIVANRRMVELGSAAIERGARVLTHCNTGPLAAGGVGTAFGVIAAAWRTGKLGQASFTETRPWLQGARLTAWEFSRAGVPAVLMTEAAAGDRALRGGFDWLVVGADRIAANGDVANKVGTAALAALTRRGGGRVMVVAPFATVDRALASGDNLPIEHREPAEIWEATGAKSVPPGIGIANPVFDVTRAVAVDMIVTERGMIHPSQGESFSPR
jgi:methylthioribose-1-phosphate isomerase